MIIEMDDDFNEQRNDITLLHWRRVFRSMHASTTGESGYDRSRLPVLHPSHRTISMITIATQEDLMYLRARLHRLSIGREDHEYTFLLPTLSQNENERFTMLMRQWLNECGCGIGSLFMILAVVVEILLWLFTGDKVISMTMRSLWWSFAAVVAAAFVGKLFGLVVARWRMLRLVRRAAASLHSYHRGHTHGQSLPRDPGMDRRTSREAHRRMGKTD